LIAGGIGSGMERVFEIDSLKGCIVIREDSIRAGPHLYSS
jgi:hypothetical protein